jgi:hypothetical protein
VRLISAVALTLALSACQGGPPAPSRPSAPSQPTATSKSDLPIRAERVYKRYLLDLQKVSEDRNHGYERLKPYLSPEAYTEEARSFQALSKRGVHTVGTSKVRKFVTQRVNVELGTISAYACVDLSGVRLVDKAGRDITPSSRPDRQTFLPSFALSNETLRLEENGTWSGDSIC